MQTRSLILLACVIVFRTTQPVYSQILRWDNNQVILGTEGITPAPGVQLVHRELEYAQLLGFNLTGANFEHSNLTSALLLGSTLTNANLTGANLTNAYLRTSTLTDANLSGAVLTGADFSDTTPRGFTESQLASTASYQAKNLSGIRFGENDLSGWDFSGQNLTDAGLGPSNLTGANFTAANLMRAFLGQSTLTNANLTGANLTNANLSRSNLTNTNLTGAVVTWADFRGATSFGFTRTQLESTASYQAKNMQGIGLMDNDLGGWDLSGQNLTGADVRSSTLRNANLSGANLTYAHLDFSNATGANLTGANLSEATVTGTNFAGSLGFTKEQLYSTASFQQKNLGGVGLSGFDLSQMNFSEQGLGHANFSHANLAGANLTGANLNESKLTGANLSGANFTGAHLRMSTLTDVESTYEWDITHLYSTGDVTLVAIPEPSGSLLIALALVGLGFSRRREVAESPAGRQIEGRVLIASSLLVMAMALSAQGASVGLNFSGWSETGGVPDVMGSVGPNHIVEMINGSFNVYDKTSGQRIARTSDHTFWARALRNGGGGPSPSSPFDPRIAYDPASERWFAVEADDDFNAQTRVLLGVSDGPSPIVPGGFIGDGWRAFQLDGDPGNSPNRNWADFPTLGIDRDNITISSQNWELSPPTGLSTYRWGIHSIPKADLLLPAPTIRNATHLSLEDPLFGTSPTLRTMQSPLSFGAPDGQSSLFTVTHNVGIQRWDLNNVVELRPQAAVVSGPITVDTPGFELPPGGRQPLGVQALRNNGQSEKRTDYDGYNKMAFSANLAQQGNRVWGVHPVDANGRSGVRWYEIDLTSNQVVQYGTLSEPTFDMIYPSIAVNPFGDVVIGFTATGESLFPSAYAIVGDTLEGTTAFGDPIELKRGNGTYLSLDRLGRNRWGDYSATVIDPSDPYSFWTFQEFTQAQDQWRVQISQIDVRGGATRTELIAPALTYSVQETASADGVFDGEGDTVGPSTASTLRVGEFAAAGIRRLERGVMKFALPTTPGLGPQLQNATMRIYLQNMAGMPAGPLSLLHSVSDNDLERLASDYQNTSYLDTRLDLVQPNDALRTYYELDVTEQVRADLTLDGANSLSAFRLQTDILEFGNDDLIAQYVLSSGIGTGQNNPQLRLTFVPEPSTSLLLLTSLLGLFGALRRPTGTVLGPASK